MHRTDQISTIGQVLSWLVEKENKNGFKKESFDGAADGRVVRKNENLVCEDEECGEGFSVGVDEGSVGEL